MSLLNKTLIILVITWATFTLVITVYTMYTVYMNQFKRQDKTKEGNESAFKFLQDGCRMAQGNHQVLDQIEDGIPCIALGPPMMNQNGSRAVYVQALASTMEFAVTLTNLQNLSLSEEHTLLEFKVVGSRGPGGQCSPSFLDEKAGATFYALVAVSRWNSFKGDEYDPKTLGIVAEDEETMSILKGIRLDLKGNMWVVSTALQEFTSLDPNSGKMRFFLGLLPNAIKGTVSSDEL